MKQFVVIEDWDGDGGIRIPDEALQEMGVDVGDSLYLLEEYVGNTRCIVLSKTPRIPDRVDELVGHWESFGKLANDLDAKDE
ncbi:MAG: AbrB/MazE/SpoVT family DNA-binding domain-containing protein [Gammaproteobacteria bacterium]|nr:AbrB/MazE/SpoVT family DNA-binding domain-containing protein [Gammaproteobacteria bacterium]MBU0883244.1 AbrB/MazE/SpoVT family DNA-binding domain-containing protein [Gammaproteobacteria bacterium]MBU1861794.1 AbrB/MazE/SpoVT family DNA-binding domain-containing protein [Gammaproteobacteria bacterium]